MIKNCANCDHCFVKMNGSKNAFCDIDGSRIDNPYEEIDCEDISVTNTYDEEFKEKVNEIADTLVDLYVKVKSLINEEVEIDVDEEDEASAEEPSGHQRKDNFESPPTIHINDETMESIIRKLLG